MLTQIKLLIGKIDNKEIWEDFLRSVEEKTFLQSWNWGEFEKAMGKKVWRLGVLYRGPSSIQSKEFDLLGMMQVILVEARRGRYLLVPHGPLLYNENPKSEARNSKQIPNSKSQILNSLLEALKKIAKEEKCGFIRIAPTWERTEENIKLFRDLGFRQAPLHVHPELTWVLDISKGEEEILAGMRKTTRYLIKQAQKYRDLEILKSQNVQNIEVFNQLYQRTAQRHHFVPFSLQYLKNEFLAFRDSSPRPAGSAQNDNRGGDPSAASPPQDDNSRSDAIIFLAKYRNEYIASAIVVFWQGIAFYHQGASITSKIPAAYLLQWEAIREAKKRGCKLYNLWGIADINSQPKIKNYKLNKNQKIKIKNSIPENHPWYGLSLFKMGFGGYPMAYVKTQDLPLSWRYWLTRTFETLRKKKRRF